MEMKYCIVPDIHGRTFWKRLQSDIIDYDKVVFLGDYVDPYVDYDGISKEDALYNFIEILDFARKNKEKVTLLLGNHDLHYFPSISERWGCRRDDERYKTIQTLFLENINMFKICDIINTNLYGKILVSHAGINLGWYRKWFDGMIDRQIIDKINSTIENFDILNKYVWNVGYSRGGDYLNGSIVWSDLGEHSTDKTAEVNKEIGVDYQIFAHTYAYPSTDEIYECEAYSMIDNKQLYEID